MLITKLVLTVPLLVLLRLPTGDGVCTKPPEFISWDEQRPNGSQLFNVSKTAADTVSFKISNKTAINQIYRGDLENCFNLTTGEDWYAVTLVEVLNLERFYQIWDKAILTSIILDIDCVVKYEVQIANTGINEFPPTFIYGPYNTTLSELATIGTTIYDFTGRARDDDIPKAILYFSISDYNIKEYDGKDFFYMPGGNGNGVVVLKKQVDFDSLTRNFFRLNISVEDAADSTRRNAFTTLTITVLDEDDQNPVFAYPGCSGSSCIVPPYEAITGLTETGLLDIIPPIRVTDRDGLNTPMRFSILSGNETGLFKIDAVTGAITQLKSVLQEKLPDEEFRVVIQVKKQSTLALSALAILTVRVRERMSSYNGTLPDYPDDESQPEKSDSLLIPLIVLGVILFILVAAIIVVVLVIRRKQKQALVRPVDTKSEPQTEEEELPTDREDHYNDQSRSSERLVSGVPSVSSGALVYRDLPSGRGRTLPPLPSRDFATETESGTKKKRSRRRKKQKDPEIFDGTKDYNMGADPEFFDSTDKSKVKRSTRSYTKDTDPQLRLKVPNDEPTND